MIVFIEMPAAGHVNPSLPIVRELTRRGERVVYLCAEEFRAAVEAAGAELRAYPDGSLASRDIAEATQSGDLGRVPARILEACEALVPWTVAQLRELQPAVAVMDSNALWGHMACKQLGIRRVSLMTTFMLGGPLLKRVTWREWWRMARPMLPGLPRVLKARSRLLARFGKQSFPDRPVFPARGDLNLALFPREMQPENPLVDESFRFVGPTVAPAEAGQGPLVYISLGTLHAGGADFYRACFEAFGDMPRRFLLACPQELGPAPANFTVVKRAPQLAVLREATAFVTHGGMNSALEALLNGVPMVVVPQQVEQLLIGLQLEQRGAAVLLRETMRGEAMRPERLRAALTRVLGEPGFRDAARAFLPAMGGARQAADEILACRA